MPTSPLLEEQAEWVRLFREDGDSRYFEKLYLSSRRVIFARCLRLLKEESQAEDATHETFLRAYQRIGDFRGENFLAWVHSIATHLCLNRLRQARTHRQLEPKIREGQTTAPAPDQELHRKRAVDRAAGVLKTLGAEQRKVLLLKYLEGFSYAEIAALTGFDHDRIRSLLQNGKRNFRLRWRQLSENRRP